MPLRPPNSRSFSRTVWRASLTPFLGSLVAFSFALVAFGATVYVFSVPAMVVNDTPYVAPLSWSSGSEGENGAQGISQGASDDLQGAEDAQEGAIGEEDEGFPSLGSAGLSSPFISAIDRVNSSVNEVPTTPPDQEVPDTPTVTPPENPSTPDVKPDPEPPSGLSKEEELAIFDRLAGYYSELPSLYEQVLAAYKQFYELHGTLSAAKSRGYMITSNSLYNKCAGAWNVHFVDMSTGHDYVVPQESRYYSSYLDMLELNKDLSQSALILRNAWKNKVSGKSESEYMEYILAAEVDGQSKYLLDFYERYPKANPS